MTELNPDATDRSPERNIDPRAPRNSVMLSAMIERAGGGAPTRHRVRDLSAGGLRIDQAVAIHVGEAVRITVGAIESAAATVAWVRNGAAGLRFAHVINPDDARAKAIVAPRPPQQPSIVDGIVPTAGWIPDLTDPYRR